MKGWKHGKKMRYKSNHQLREEKMAQPKMVKVLSPDGIIIGVYETEADVPDRLPNRFHTFSYDKEDCDVVKVTDPKDYERLLPSMRKS